jgi:hypothetical protein
VLFRSGTVYVKEHNMPPISPANTARYFIYYKANGKGHKTQFRYNDGGTPAQPELGFRNNVTVFLNTVAALMPSNLTYVKATFAATNSNIELPADLPLLLAGGAAAPMISNLPASLSITGKSPFGRAWNFKMLGVGISPANNTGVTEDYRLYPAENPTAAAILSALAGLDQLAIDGLIPIVNPYVNLGYNAYWQKKARG